MPKLLKLSRINTALLILIILVNGYVIAAPFAPAVIFWAHNQGQQRQQLTQEVATPAPKATPINGPNQLIIPAMLFKQPIHEGSDATFADIVNVLKKGAWRWPESSTPDKGGNTVILGHRFTYTDPRGVFYYLNKVHTGDQIGVVWNGKKYVYTVVKTQVVPPSDTKILASTKDPQLTLYTCTPLWWPKDRLVVTAKLESVS